MASMDKDCPSFMKCPITLERMIDPVVVSDGHSYERFAIQDWFDKGNRISPLTGQAITTNIIPNQSLKIQIDARIDSHLRGKVDMNELNHLKAQMFNINSSEEAFSLIHQIIILVTKSKHCLLGIHDIDSMKALLIHKKLMTDDIIDELNVLSKKCESEIKKKKIVLSKLAHQCEILKNLSTNVNNKNSDMFAHMKKIENKLKLSEKTIAALNNQLKDIQSKLRHRKELLVEIRKNYDKAKIDYNEHNEGNLSMQSMFHEYSNQKQMVELQLMNVSGSDDGTKEGECPLPPSSSSSSSSSSVASKCENISSKSVESPSSKRRKTKHVEKPETNEKKMEGSSITPPINNGQWLFEESCYYYFGCNFKKQNHVRCKILMEEAANLNYELAIAVCTYWGSGKYKKDIKNAYLMVENVYKNTPDYHWAPTLLGRCYFYGYGPEQNFNRAFELYLIAANLGNSVAMRFVGYCYKFGKGVEQNHEKASEYFLKGAEMGNSGDMYNCGKHYQTPPSAATKLTETNHSGTTATTTTGINQDELEWYFLFD